MRPIKFRALRKDGGGFLYGEPTDFMRLGWRDEEGERFYLGHPKVDYLLDIAKKDMESFEANPEPIEQWTGLVDKSGKEIYEGDFVTYGNKKTCDCGNKEWFDNKWEIAFEKGAFRLKGHGSKFVLSEGCEVIGNIHQNPELL